MRLPARFLSATAATWLLCGAAPASALESAWVQAPQSGLRLIAGAPATGEVELRGGIELRLDRGWHTYWRYPGDAGVPPRFDWSASDNVAAIEVRWPAPVRIATKEGAISIGYEDGVVFPLRIRPIDPKLPVKLALKLEFAVCERLCIPAEARARLEVPPGVGRVPLLDQADARVPRRARLGDAPGFAILTARLERGTKPRALIEVKAPAGALDLFAEGPNEQWALPLPEKIAAPDGRTLFAIPIDGAPPGSDPIPARLRLTLVAGAQAIEVEAPLD